MNICTQKSVLTELYLLSTLLNSLASWPSHDSRGQSWFDISSALYDLNIIARSALFLRLIQEVMLHICRFGLCDKWKTATWRVLLWAPAFVPNATAIELSERATVEAHLLHLNTIHQSRSSMLQIICRGDIKSWKASEMDVKGSLWCTIVWHNFEYYADGHS